MSGYSQVVVPPSELDTPAGLTVGGWYRGIPNPGISGMPAVGGVADCRNLIAMSPPTLLEAYEITSLAIAWGGVIENNPLPNPPALGFELALLVNDRVAWVNQQEYATQKAANNVVGFASGILVADIVNPVRLGARDRLGLRIGISSNEVASTAYAVVGAQLDGSYSAYGVESTISYNVIDLPGRRRL